MLSAAPNPLFFSLCPRLREETHWAASPAPGRACFRSENNVGKKLCRIYFNWTEASGEWGCKRTCYKYICLSSYFIFLRHGKLRGENSFNNDSKGVIFKKYLLFDDIPIWSFLLEFMFIHTVNIYWVPTKCLALLQILGICRWILGKQRERQ